jgi:hypothetical protein
VYSDTNLCRTSKSAVPLSRLKPALMGVLFPRPLGEF